MRVATNNLARLFQMDESGILRPITSDTGSFTFSGFTGANISKQYAPGPASKVRETAVFRKIVGGVHAGQYIRVTDQGSTWVH